MEPIEFLSMGLTPGTRVKVFYASDKYAGETAEFKGYYLCSGKPVPELGEHVFPVFEYPKIFGKPGREAEKYVARFDEIISLHKETGDSVVAPVGVEEALVLAGTADTLRSRASATIRTIVRETQELFPGTAISIPRECWIRCIAYVDERDQVGTITNLIQDRNGYLNYIVDLGDYACIVPSVKIKVIEPCELLHALYEAIAWPFDREEDGTIPLVPESVTVKDIPDSETISRKAPILHRYGVIERLRENVIFRNADIATLRKEFTDMDGISDMDDDDDFRMELVCWWLNQATASERDQHCKNILQ